jgi:hypothetical protein
VDEMSSLVKKSIVIALAGLFILASAASLSVEAAAGGKLNHKKEIDPARVTARMSEVYGVSQLALLKYHEGGMNFKELHRAAYFAGISGKSLDEVIALKADSKTWRNVSQTLKISKEQHKAQRQKLFAARLQQRTGVAKETSLVLLQEGRKSRDVAMAGILAKHSGKSAIEVINMKKPDGKWREVATELGMDKQQYRKALKQTRALLPHHRHHGCKKQ